MKVQHITSLRGLVISLGLMTSAALAQTPSPSVGYVSFNLPATAAPTTTYLSAPLVPDDVFTGKPGDVSSDTITVPTASWTAGAFAGATPYYVYVKSGAQAGRVLRVLANTGTTVTLDLTDDSEQSTALNATGFAFTTSDTFEICSGYTLGSFFGENATDQILTAGTGAGVADTVGLWNRQLNRFQSYYFHSGANEWRESDSTARANTVVLTPNATLAISRRSGRAAVQLVQLGRVPTVAPLLKHAGGTVPRYYGIRLPVDMKFSQIALGSNWTKNDSAFKADTLSVFNAATERWEAYYQRLDGGWRKSGSTAAQDNTVVPSGTAIAFTKRAAVSGSASFHPITLPYVP